MESEAAQGSVEAHARLAEEPEQTDMLQHESQQLQSAGEEAEDEQPQGAAEEQLQERQTVEAPDAQQESSQQEQPAVIHGQAVEQQPANRSAKHMLANLAVKILHVGCHRCLA